MLVTVKGQVFQRLNQDWSIAISSTGPASDAKVDPAAAMNVVLGNVADPDQVLDQVEASSLSCLVSIERYIALGPRIIRLIVLPARA
jgi:hypothetical protein